MKPPGERRPRTVCKGWESRGRHVPRAPDGTRRVLAVVVPAVHAWALVNLGRRPVAHKSVLERMAEADIVAVYSRSHASPKSASDTAAFYTRSRAGVMVRPGLYLIRQGLVTHRLDLDRLPVGRVVAVATRDARGSDMLNAKVVFGPELKRPGTALSWWLDDDDAAAVRSQLGVESGRLDYGQLSLLGGV